MRLSYKKPAKCLKELHSPEQQESNTHRLFIKLCWLMDTPYRWKRSAPRAETRDRRSMLSPADTTRLNEHIMKVTDVLCLTAGKRRPRSCSSRPLWTT